MEASATCSVRENDLGCKGYKLSVQRQNWLGSGLPESEIRWLIADINLAYRRGDVVMPILIFAKGRHHRSRP
jgi:hypothetical protein